MSDESLELDLPESINEAFSEIQELRGKPNPEYDQYFVTLDTSYQRILLENPENYEKKRIVFLGDMDLSSLSLGMVAKPRDLAVLDIDKRIPEIVFKLKFDYKMRCIRYINHDIRIRMLAIMKNQFDYVFLEPPLTKEGLEVGLSRAIQCASKVSPSKIYLSFDDGEENNDWINEMVNVMDLEIDKKLPNFNKYAFPTPLEKKTSDMYILKVKSSSKETIANHYFGPTYFRESAATPKSYKCKCGIIYSIGDAGDFSTLKALEEKKCSECGYDGPFLYNSSVYME
ncbi:MAG: bis-aminopropyl spermidine synthase family protein [Candidatus Heimdallarchaeota archaeon]|nr:bis-aminopropyl spermidine synthase family protein [Candidatus Heimdallarchaeota archaeon]